MVNEVNVTDHGVVPDSPDDQTESIRQAFEKLGNLAQGFGATIYFPLGTYLHSGVLRDLNRLTCKITIRGDGPNKTILKYYPVVHYSDTRLSAFKDTSGTAWVVGTSPPPQDGYGSTLSVASTNTAGNKDTSAASPTSTVLTFVVDETVGQYVIKFKRLLGSSFTGTRKLQILDNDAVVHTADDAASSPTLNAWAEKVYTSPTGLTGSHKISFRFVDTVGSGAGSAVVIERISIENVNQQAFGFEESVFKIAATDTNNASGFSIRDLTLDGGLKNLADDSPRPGSMRPVRWFFLEGTDGAVSNLGMENVTFQNTYGPGIHAEFWIDSVLQNIVFANVGRAEAGAVVAGVRLKCYGSNSQGTECSNLKFDNCRWENHPYIATLVDEYCRQIFFPTCKWHGKLLEGTIPPIAFPQVKINPNSYGISFTGCRFANTRQAHLFADKATIVVTGSVFSGAGTYIDDPIGAYAIDLKDCVGCAITGNNFAVSNVFDDTSNTEPRNKSGNVRMTRGRNNVMACNGIWPTPVILIDEFKQGTTASGAIGEFGWTLNGFSGGTVNILADLQGHPGIYEFKNNPSVPISGLVLDNIYNDLLDPAYDFDLTFVLKVLSTTGVGYTFGLTSQDANVFIPTNGIYIYKGTGSSVWHGICRTGGNSTQTTSDLGNVDTAWHAFRIRRLEPAKIGFSSDLGVERVVTTNIPTSRLNAFLAINNTNDAEKTVHLDYFDLKVGLPL